MPEQNHPQLILRAARPGDGETLLHFIRELAAHEGRPQDVSATAEEMERQLFEEKAAEAALAKVGSEIVGYAIYYAVYRSFSAGCLLYVEDVYVSPACRGRGYGRQIFAYLEETARARGYAGLCWAGLANNASAIGFYASIGAAREEGKAHFLKLF